MALDKNSLRDALVKMMTNAGEQSWTKNQVADAMAGAIDDYVRAGAVAGVVVGLPDGTSATQTNTAGLA
jgi:hypothetical protein